MESGKWPIWAFDSERAAAFWASEKPLDRWVWEVVEITLGSPQRGRKIPESYELEPRFKTTETNDDDPSSVVFGGVYDGPTGPVVLMEG
jgi:hypothetical protein